MERKALQQMILAGSLFAIAVTGAVLLMVRNQSIKKVSEAVRKSASYALEDTLNKLKKGELEPLS